MLLCLICMIHRDEESGALQEMALEGSFEGNVPLAYAHGRCTAAALSCIQWKAHYEFHVPHMIIQYLQQFNI